MYKQAHNQNHFDNFKRIAIMVYLEKTCTVDLSVLLHSFGY